MNYPTTPRRDSRRPAQILVVEDNADQWFLIRWTLLQTFPEVEPIWVADPTQAMAYLGSCEEDQIALPRLILLDLYLPCRTMGWHLLETIKTHYLYREIPVVVLSNSSDPEDIRESYLHRGSSYIAKPSSYPDWLECFTHFRYYWWNTVTLPKADLSLESRPRKGLS